MIGDRPDGISVGAVFARAFAVIRANPLGTLGLTFVLTALPSLLLGLTGLNANYVEGFRDGAYVLASIFGIVAMILWLVTSGALVEATIAHDRGLRPAIADQLRLGVLRSLPLLGVSMLLLLGIYFASLLLLIPGVMLAVRWAVAWPAVIAERTGVFGAFGRSNQLTAGARWQILGIGLVVLVVYILFTMVTPLVIGASKGLFSARVEPGGMALLSLPQQLLQSLLTTLAVTWTAIVGTALFIDLRRWKDGPDHQEFVDIFS